MKSFFVYSEGLVGVKTNLSSFKWPLGRNAPAASEEHFKACRVRICLDAVPERKVFEKDTLSSCDGIFRSFFAHRNRMDIHFERRLFGFIPLRFSIFVKDGEIHARVGRAYLRLIRLKLMNLHPIGYILFELATAMLLNEGIMPVYGAALSIKNEGTLIMGPPDSGKTLTALLLEKRLNAEILSEDIALFDGEKLYPVPWTDTCRNYGGITEAKRGRASEPVALSRIIIIEKGTDGAESTASPDKKLRILNDYGIRYKGSPVLSVLSYFNDGFSLDELYRKELSIMKRLQKTEKTCISAKDSLSFAEEIEKLSFKE